MFVKEITKETIFIKAPAKVNLFLEVLNKRQDGYHNINSLFQAVSLYDNLTFSLMEKPEIEINLVNDVNLSTKSDNLISKAYHLMKKTFDFKYGLKVTLEKNIPLAAGLGRRVSLTVVFCTIIACNTLCKLGLDNKQMGRLALSIGADVPFFFTSGQALVQGKGEIIRETNYPDNYSMVLVCPEIFISTAVSYQELKRGLTFSKIPFNLAACHTTEEFISSLGLADNDFEKIHLRTYPELERIKDVLLRNGAQLARMSGSGPTIFGIFLELPDIKDDNTVVQGNWHFDTVRPITLYGQV
ncbi:MAG: 4-(cytidine 5'-diphospho)-2-C-methyl-D-erythritol kinase [FCB group bacterium]|nr:4-(cytidine 5'-diphospho)-2-C-methyl-D-erythritol kinase [FCB group bacterium]